MFQLHPHLNLHSCPEGLNLCQHLPSAPAKAVHKATGLHAQCTQPPWYLCALHKARSFAHAQVVMPTWANLTLTMHQSLFAV